MPPPLDLSPYQHIVILTGAGVSAESGLLTYRGPGGVWDETRCSRPACPACGAALRPDVMLFDEELPARALWETKRALRDCDLFIAIGTSGHVSPASSFVRSAADAGARTVFINLEPLDPPNPAFRDVHLGRAGELLPGLVGVPG